MYFPNIKRGAAAVDLKTVDRVVWFREFLADLESLIRREPQLQVLIAQFLTEQSRRPCPSVN